MATGLNSRGGRCENSELQSGRMVGQGQFFIYLPKRVDANHYVRTPVKVKAEMILSPNQLDGQNLASIVIPCRARAEKVSTDNMLSVINVPIKIEAELLLTPDMYLSCRPPTYASNTEILGNVTAPCGPDIRQALSTSTTTRDEKDAKTLTEKPTERDDPVSAACEETSREELPPATFNGIERTYPTTNRPDCKGLLTPEKNFKGLSELSTNLQPQHQKAVGAKRRDPIVCQGEQIFAQRKLEREKHIRTSSEIERKKNNLYLQQYLKRESFSRQSSIQDAEAVRRRETLMKELGLKLKDELGMRHHVHRFMRNFPAIRSNLLKH